MTRHWFEEILSFVQFSFTPDKDKQIMEFLSEVNDNLLKTVTPGNIITIYESMIKSYHRDLKGKLQIKRKPRHIGNEIKDLSDGRLCIALYIVFFPFIQNSMLIKLMQNRKSTLQILLTKHTI